MKKFLSLVCFSALFTGAIIAQTQYNATTYHQFNTNYGYIQVGAQNISFAHIYSDRPNFIFNKPVYSMNGFLSYNSDLNLEAASGYYVQIKPRSSSYGLVLREYNSNDYGNIEVTSDGLGFGYNTPGYNLLIKPNGNVGIGTLGSDGAKLSIKAGWGDWMQFQSNSNTGYWGIHNNSGQMDFQIYYHNIAGQNIWPFSIRQDGTLQTGAIGINTSKLDGYQLAVNGGILCESIAVQQDVPNSDYVFESDYNLRSIKEIEEFVKENKHLPEVPSAQKFKENGYKLGEMDDILLRKVEELTLYLIEQNKRIEALEAENKELKFKSN